MATTDDSIMEGGRTMSDSPPPERARAETRLRDSRPSVPLELQVEMDAWDQASAEALALVERLASEGGVDDARRGEVE